jgi:type II restriction enzyme
VVDGAYATMMGRLAASNNPNLILMNYDKAEFSVTDLFIVPKQFFTQEVIEQRKPLSPTARRAGWVGCNIRLDQVPASGKVYLVRERQLMPRAEVLERWRSTLFLRGATAEARGWLIEVMKCVEQLGLATFGIEDAYSFEEHLSRLYPNNQNVRP